MKSAGDGKSGRAAHGRFIYRVADTNRTSMTRSKNLITHEEVIKVVFHFVAVPRDAGPHIVLTTAVLH